jgi:hypothetical protein
MYWLPQLNYWMMPLELKEMSTCVYKWITHKQLESLVLYRILSTQSPCISGSYLFYALCQDIQNCIPMFIYPTKHYSELARVISE